MSNLTIKLIPGLYEELGGEAGNEWVKIGDTIGGSFYRVSSIHNSNYFKEVLLHRSAKCAEFHVIISKGFKGCQWPSQDSHRYLRITDSQAAAILSGREIEPGNKWGIVRRTQQEIEGGRTGDLVFINGGGKLDLWSCYDDKAHYSELFGSTAGELGLFHLPAHTYRLSTNLLELDADFAKAAGIEGTE